ncbi:serine hydrolase domain-containing protein [Isoptericola sp. NPDC057559]|uniref:serine hydrolase domain-containing protein n=1 Tax=Isoptericola sp. NPDC057559 TaxID=3346168 RepID=UPI0036787841
MKTLAGGLVRYEEICQQLSQPVVVDLDGAPVPTSPHLPPDRALLDGRTADEGWSSAAALLTTPAGTARAVADGPAGPGETHVGSLFDLASVTKAFVAVAAATVVDDGLLDLDAPVRETLDVPSAAAGATARHLLTHCAGLRPTSLAWRGTADPDAVLADALGAPVAPPGAVHRYSCLGYVTLGRLLEELTGERLDRLVLRRVGEPIGATGLRWSPVGARPGRPGEVDVVPTERGTPTGRVHDELAAAAGRPVGNAGLFGTLDDVARLARLVADRGAAGGSQVVSEDGWRGLVEPDAGARRAGAPWGQALGLRRGDPAFMASGDQVGHAGFTGTSFVVDLATGASAVLLTNRVHAGRESSVEGRRRRLATLAADGAGARLPPGGPADGEASLPGRLTEVRG